jgi:hypothetical protein
MQHVSISGSHTAISIAGNGVRLDAARHDCFFVIGSGTKLVITHKSDIFEWTAVE